jgi:simple sugar transport system ATP-binding protein
VDVGAAQLIHRALIGLRDAGAALLVISEELDELFTICDRIAVLTAGTLSAAQPRSQLTVEAVGLLMAGAAAPGAPPGSALGVAPGAGPGAAHA